MSTAPATIDVDAYRVTRTVTIEAPIERVWRAVTEPAEIAQWFGQRATLDRLEVGGEGVLGWDGHGDFPWRIVELDEPSVFAFEWGRPGEPIRDDNSTRARFTLTSTAGGTELTVTETGFERLSASELDRRAAMEDNRDGWTSELDELIAYLSVP